MRASSGSTPRAADDAPGSKVGFHVICGSILPLLRVLGPQPVLRLRMMEAMRTRKIAQLEQQRKSRVILLVHRQETMRFLGFPLMRYIDINDSEQVLRAI